MATAKKKKKPALTFATLIQDVARLGFNDPSVSDPELIFRRALTVAENVVMEEDDTRFVFTLNKRVKNVKPTTR